MRLLILSGERARTHVLASTTNNQKMTHRYTGIDIPCLNYRSNRLRASQKGE
ncbi:MAG: hypothetical protein JWN15_3637 [Firmicutes bacterium]|nr:hypothetical protein [Bacillota bacterium]